jgi:hypothetical protein
MEAAYLLKHLRDGGFNNPMILDIHEACFLKRTDHLTSNVAPSGTRARPERGKIYHRDIEMRSCHAGVQTQSRVDDGRQVAIEKH